MTSLSISEKIGIKINILRKRLKISQEKLDELANLSSNSVSAIEHGESNPTIETLDRIAKALNIELKELVDVSKIDL